MDSLELGNEFQDFVCIELAKYHVILQNINSKKYQYQVGENLQGFEIKYDSRFYDRDPTKRLSIEIAEKTNAKNSTYVNSGIYRNDNTFIYIQGSYKCFYMFSVYFLRQLHMTGKFIESTLPTIKTFFIPESVADKYCIRKFKLIAG